MTTTKNGGMGIEPAEKIKSTIAALDACRSLAEYMAGADMIPDSYYPSSSDEKKFLKRNGRPMNEKDRADIAVSRASLAIVKGANLGLDPLEALSNMFVVGSRVDIYGSLLARLIQEHPSYVYHRVSHEGTGKTLKCVIKAKRSDQDHEIELEYSIADAEQAGLVAVGEAGDFWTYNNYSSQFEKTGNWAKYPKDMLVWKALKRLRDRYFADVATGIGVVEDMEGSKEDDQWVNATEVGDEPVTLPGKKSIPHIVEPEVPKPKTIQSLYDEVVEKSRSLEDDASRFENINSFIFGIGKDDLKKKDPDVHDKAFKLWRKYKNALNLDIDEPEELSFFDIVDMVKPRVEFEKEADDLGDVETDKEEVVEVAVVEVIEEEEENKEEMVVDSAGSLVEEAIAKADAAKDYLAKSEYDSARKYAEENPVDTIARIDVLVAHTKRAVDAINAFIKKEIIDGGGQTYLAAVEVAKEGFKKSLMAEGMKDSDMHRLGNIEMIQALINPQNIKNNVANSK